MAKKKNGPHRCEHAGEMIMLKHDGTSWEIIHAQAWCQMPGAV